MSIRKSCFSYYRHRKRKCKLFGLLIVLIPAFIYSGIQLYWPVFHVFINKDINSPCVLPQFDIYDASIANFFWTPDPIKCEPWDSLMFIDSDGMLQLNSSVVAYKRYNDLTCVYQMVQPDGEKNVNLINETVYRGPVYIATDIIYVQCKEKNNLIYDNLHFHVDFKSILSKKAIEMESSNDLSVYMFGLDSMSMLLAKRKMPLTMKYLKDDLGAYILNGYTKVADNSYPNLIPLMTGRSVVELEGIASDDLPFIWKEFASRGYVDMYSEDWPSLATFSGFTRPIACHYFNNFFLAIEKTRTQTIRNVKRLLLFMEHHNFRLQDISYLCFGNTPKHKLIINYYKRFIEAYRNRRKFGLSFLIEIGHDFINFFEHADKDTMDFFKWMKETDKLENAVLILYADHGPRYSEIQNTGIGRVTSMMPTMVVYIPDQIRQRFPHLHNNFVKNQERLTTAFDVHETMMDILKQNFQSRKPVDESAMLPRGISLFREVPISRSCHEARIPEHYCPCYSSSDISTEDPIVRKASYFMVQNINSLLNGYLNMCAKLTLNSTKRASIVRSNFVRDKEKEEFSFRTYVYTSGTDTRLIVAIETSPNNGVYEATIQYDGGSGMKILGDINRLNRYNNQSYCIPDRQNIRRLYCLCI